jgi:glutamine synthetase adenylyltransferase
MTPELPDWHRQHGLPAPAAEALDTALEALEARAELTSPLAHLLERMRDEGVPAEVLGEPLAAEALVRLAYAAPFLLRHLTRHPQALAEGVLSGLSAASRGAGRPGTARLRPWRGDAGLRPWRGDAGLRPWRGDAAPASVAGLPEPELMARLRAWKYDNYARLTAADLLGLHDARTTCRLLSDLADGMIRIAYEYGFACLAARQGLPLRADGALAGGAVVGMGKLGGRELNYASDIDLIFVHAGDDAPCRMLEAPPVPPIDPGGDPDLPWAFWREQAGRARNRTHDRAAGGESSRESSGEFHIRLARLVSRLLSTQTAEGFGFRVDCDLRPNGRSGLLAPALDFMERY